MREQTQRVLATYERKRRSLEKELSAAADVSEASDVQRWVGEAIFGTDLAFLLCGEFCELVSQAEEETVAAYAATKELSDRAQRLVAEGRARQADAPEEIRRVMEAVLQQQQSAADLMAASVAKPYAVNVWLWRELLEVMADSLSELYTAADRRAVLNVMKVVLRRLVDMTPVGLVAGIYSDIKEMWELRDDAPVARELAEGGQRYSDYTEATLHLAILISRLSEVRSASTDASLEEILGGATKRIEEHAGRLLG